MRKYVLIGCGGFIGAILRQLVEGIRILSEHNSFPLNTLIINVSGAFLLALILTIAFEVWPFDSDIRHGLTTGLLGAFTTFSTLCKETVELLKKGDYLSAASYLLVSTLLGLAAAYLGIVLARQAGVRLRQKQEKPESLGSDESDVN